MRQEKLARAYFEWRKKKMSAAVNIGKSGELLIIHFPVNMKGFISNIGKNMIVKRKGIVT